MFIVADLVSLSHQRVSQRALRTSLKKQLDPMVQLLLEGGPYQYFVRKPIATCYILGVGGVQTPCPASLSAHVSQRENLSSGFGTW